MPGNVTNIMVLASPQLLSQDFKKMPVQNCNSKISAHPDLATQLLQTRYQLILFAFFVKRGNLHFSHILENNLVITRQKVKIEIFSWNCLPVPLGGFQETACQKDRLDSRDVIDN